MWRIGRVKTFRRLIDHIVNRHDDEKACRAWAELEALKPQARLELLGRSLRVKGRLDPRITHFLYLYGYRFPEETVAVLAPLLKENYLVAWQILAAQLSRKDVLLRGQRLQPFHPFPQDEVPLIISPPLGFEHIRDFLSAGIWQVEVEGLVAVLEALAETPSQSLLALFTDVVCDAACEFERRLFTALGVKLIAEQVATAITQSEWLEQARRLAVVVADSNEDRTLRHELAYVFLSFPLSEGAAAINKLIEDTEADGFGAAYLPRFRELLEQVEQATLTRTNKVWPDLPAEDVVAVLLHYSKHPTVASNPRSIEALTQGSLIHGPDGSAETINYTGEVIANCVGILKPLDEEDTAWCNRYIHFLIQTVSLKGPADEAFYCIVVAANRAGEKERLEEILDLLGVATELQAGSTSPLKLQYLCRLGQFGLIAAQMAREQGDLELSTSLYARTAGLLEGKDAELEGGALLSLGILRMEQGDAGGALAPLERACHLFKIAEDRENHATALMELGIVEMEFKEFSAARKHLEAALDFYQELEAPENLTGLPHCLSNLIELFVREGINDKPQLLRMLDAALDMSRQRGDDALEEHLLEQKERLAGATAPPSWRY